MTREQLTNVETEAQCQALSRSAFNISRCLSIRGWYPNLDMTANKAKRRLVALADRIIALRSQQVTP
jgi:hypothetical protein